MKALKDQAGMPIIYIVCFSVFRLKGHLAGRKPSECPLFITLAAFESLRIKKTVYSVMAQMLTRMGIGVVFRCIFTGIAVSKFKEVSV